MRMRNSWHFVIIWGFQGMFNNDIINRMIRYCVGYLGVKASTYGILFWLPDYLKSNGVGDETATISQVYELS